MASRAAAVVRIRINPHKFVGYLDEGTDFVAVSSDGLDRTVQGVKFTWESSNTNKLEIDETGRARFLESGLAWVTCRAGSAVATAPVLIRPNHRPRQTDAEWRADQRSLGVDGVIRGDGGRTTDDGSIASIVGTQRPTATVAGQPSVVRVLSSLVDKLAPTAFAQGGGCIECPGGWHSDDLGYDELWSEPRNRLGSPRDGVVEPMPLGTVLPEGSNFKWALPLETLGGRGLATNLTLYYNSRVWSRRDSRVAFDAISGWPAPGFSLGYGRMMVYDIGTGLNPTCKFMLVDGDDTRHYLGVGTWDGSGYQTGGPLETSDGTHIVYTGNARDGGDLRYADGTRVTYNPVNNRLVPTRITEKNGNYVQISYKVDEAGTFPPMAIESVVDTLGRLAGFEYDSAGHLTSVGGGTSFVKFDYQNITTSYNFSGLTVERQPTTSLRLRHIYFPATGTGYMPSYSQYGMIYSVSARRQMTTSGGWPPGTPVVITDGVESANVSFNYPTSGSTQLTDAPAFTQRTESAVNSPTAVYTYSSSTDAPAQTMTFSIARPDSTRVHLTRSTNASSPANGRVVQSELKLGAASFAKVVLTYANDGGGSPHVQSVTVSDDATPANQTKVDFDRDNYGNVTNKREYGFQVGGAWQVRRRTHYTYKTDAVYINAYQRRLVTLTQVFDGVGNTSDADDVLIAKTSYTYDDYQAMGGLENYGGTASPPGHVSYWVPLGNATGVTQWTDVVAGTTIVHLAKYDIFGNVVKAQVSCCEEATLTTTEATYWSVIEVERRGASGGAQQTTYTDYDFNSLLPSSTTDAGGLTTTYGYDAAHNLTSIVLPTGASAVAGYDYGNLSSTKTVTYLDWGGTGSLEGTMTKTLVTTTHYDGWGRVRDTINPAGAQVNTSYDGMGRVSSRTNRFATGGTPGPATTYQYDALGRGTITTLPGGNTVQNSYSGATVTATDQVNRKIKRETDGLGRLIKVTEQDSTGLLTQETNYSYNLLDKLVGVNQGGQNRSFKYDAIGRLLFEKIPEQTPTIAEGGVPNQWTTAYTYTEFSKVATKQDARAVVTNYTYDGLHRVSGISYNTSGTIAQATPSLTYAYGAGGAISSVTIGNGSNDNYYTENYTFDGYDRPESVTRWIRGQTYDTNETYTTSCEYNYGSQLTMTTYPSGKVVGLGYDDFGRLKSLPYDSHVPAGPGYLTGTTYNITGLVSGFTLGNGVSETFGFDPQRLALTSQTATASGGAQNGLMNLSYSYQAAAGQSGATSTAGDSHQLISLTGTINGTTESASYTYDLQRRLVTSNQTSNGSSAQRRFGYDRWGNRTGVWDATSGGNQIQNVALEQGGVAPTNRIQSVSVDKTNVALAANGAAATASSTAGTGFPASAVINGDRKGTNWGNGGGWHDGTGNSYPDWVQINFNGSKSINEIDVFTVQDNYSNPSEPTEQMTFATYGITDYQVQYWNGSSWVNVPGGNITGNNKVWRKLTFSDISTDKIRVNVTGALASYSRIIEIEAYQSTAAYIYDAAGDVTWDGMHSYQYDAENRLVSVDNGATAQYKYDHQNRRVSKIVGSAWTHYIWEGGRVVSEHDATTPYSASYALSSARVDYVYLKGSMVYNRQRTSSTGAWTERYYVSDIWSTRLVLDTSGNVVGRQAHLPFGEEFGGSGSQEKHHFTNYEAEFETGTDYAVNRQYAQVAGRFQSADPYQPSGYLVDPQSWNRYSYVQNDPIHDVDPLGLLLAAPRYDPCGGGPPDDIAPIKGTPPKIPICTIKVFDRSIEFFEGVPRFLRPPGARHGYIVFTDKDGRDFFFEGMKHNNALIAVDTSIPGTSHLARDNPSRDRLDGQISGSFVCDWLSSLKHAADIVNSADIEYDWNGPNSSSVLRFMLEGLPLQFWYHIPFMIGYGSRLPGIER